MHRSAFSGDSNKLFEKKRMNFKLNCFFNCFQSAVFNNHCWSNTPQISAQSLYETCLLPYRYSLQVDWGIDVASFVCTCGDSIQNTVSALYNKFSCNVGNGIDYSALMMIFFNRLPQLERNSSRRRVWIKTGLPRNVYQIQEYFCGKRDSSGNKYTSQRKLLNCLATLGFEWINVREETYEVTKTTTTWIGKDVP